MASLLRCYRSHKLGINNGGGISRVPARPPAVPCARSGTHLVLVFRLAMALENNRAPTRFCLQNAFCCHAPRPGGLRTRFFTYPCSPHRRRTIPTTTTTAVPGDVIAGRFWRLSATFWAACRGRWKLQAVYGNLGDTCARHCAHGHGANAALRRWRVGCRRAHGTGGAVRQATRVRETTQPVTATRVPTTWRVPLAPPPYLPACFRILRLTCPSIRRLGTDNVGDGGGVHQLTT